MRFSIVTASYNRAHLLPRLYSSIQGAAQSLDASLDFEWIVVDDGSSDNTSKLITDLSRQAHFPIQLVNQTHGGKHRALNRAFTKASGDWLMVVDSDDQLRRNALLQLHHISTAAAAKKAKAIMCAVEVRNADQQYQFSTANRSVSFLQRFVEEPAFDSTMIIHRSLTKAHQFPEFSGEDFLAEAAYLMGPLQDQLFWLSNEVLVEVEYQGDGLSAHIDQKRMESPEGACHIYSNIAASPVRAGQKLRAAANYGRFWWLALILKKEQLKPNNWLLALAILPGAALALRDQLRHRQNSTLSKNARQVSNV